MHGSKFHCFEERERPCYMARTAHITQFMRTSHITQFMRNGLWYGGCVIHGSCWSVVRRVRNTRVMLVCDTEGE